MERSGSTERRDSIGSSDGTGGDGKGGAGGGVSGEKHQRIALACLPCRGKKAKCSGTTPTCLQCARQNLVCEWPSGRKRKRTRKEMIEAAAAAAAAGPGGGGGGTGGDSSRRDRSQDDAGRGLPPPAPRPTGGLDTGRAMDAGPMQQQQMGQASSSSAMDFSSSGMPLWQVDPHASTQTPTDLGQARSPYMLPSSLASPQQHGFQSYQTSSQGLADWMTSSFLPPTATNSPSQQQAYASSSSEVSSVFSTHPNAHYAQQPLQPPSQSTSSHLSRFSVMPTKPPSDAMPVMNTPPSLASLAHDSHQGSSGGAGGRVSGLDLGHRLGGPSGGFGIGSSVVGGSSGNGQGKAGTGVGGQSSEKREGILKAVTDQVGYLEGESGEPYLKLYYYRVSGNTAIHPGINRICLKLQLRPPPPTSPSSAPLTVPAVPAPKSDLQDVQFDPVTDMASPEVVQPLFELFFEVAGQHFPSIVHPRLVKRFASGTMSAFLCNAMCAISARHSPLGRSNPANAGNAFLAKAHELVVPLLRMPTTDGVTGLLLLAWAEYGQNSESGFWQFSGLAIRMAVDLGFFTNTDEMYEDYSHFVRTKNLAWSLFVTDRLLALSTGRPCTIQESDIELPLPLEEEIPEGPRPPGTENDPPLPSPFVWVVKLMVICGRIANLLNGSRGRARTFVSPEAASTQELKSLQTELVGFYSRIPPSMVWSVDNFKNQAQQERGGVFLMFHCWANAVIGMLHHPAILYSPAGSDTPMTGTMNRSIKLALASSRTICECAVFADLCSPMSYTASPQLSQTLYIAGLAFIAEMKHASLGLSGMNSASASRPPSPSSKQEETNGSSSTKAAPPAASHTPGAPLQASDQFLNLLAQQNLNVIIKALRQMTHYWAGAGVMLNILTQRSQGMTHSKIDFSATSDNIKTFVSLPDSGVLRRFTSDLAPPGLSPADQLATIASMSPATSPETGMVDIPPANYEWSLENLLSTYSVQDMSVEPAGGFSFFDNLGASPTFGDGL